MNPLESHYIRFPRYQDFSIRGEWPSVDESQLPAMPNEVGQHIKETLSGHCTKGIITLDIDDTLVRGPEMQETSNAITETIDKVQKSGYLVCFSTYRCVNSATQNLHTKHHLNGPILAENGDVIAFPDSRTPAIVINNETAYTATIQLKSELDKWVKGQGDLFDYREFQDTDPDSTFLEYMNTGWQNPGKLSLWIDSQRLCGLALWPFRQPIGSESSPTSASSFYINFFDGISEYTNLRNLHTLKFHRLSTELPVIIARSNKNSKTTSWRQLSSFIGYDHMQTLRCFHIGDSPGDKISYDGVDTIAVANAHDSLKHHASYVTKGDYTKGVVEGLNYILDQE